VFQPPIAIVSEKGLSTAVLAAMKVKHTIPCDALPHFPKRGATLYVGTISDINVVYIDDVSNLRADAYTLGDATFGTRVR